MNQRQITSLLKRINKRIENPPNIRFDGVDPLNVGGYTLEMDLLSIEETINQLYKTVQKTITDIETGEHPLRVIASLRESLGT